MTPEELAASIREALAYPASYLALLTQNNPAGTVTSMLARPDVEAVLLDGLAQARETAEDAVRAAWAQYGGPQSPYLAWLLADIAGSYDVLGAIRAAVRAAWASVPPRPFVPGQDAPGSNPGLEAAVERGHAVRDAILAVGAEAALRNQLTMEVAATAAAALREIERGQAMADAGEKVWKRWRTSAQPPDERTCHWCRALNGVTIPLHGNFPAGNPEDLTGHGHLTQPPRLYHGVLQGPPRHPRCRCHLAILTGSPGSAVSSSGGSGQGAAANIAPQSNRSPARGGPRRPAGYLTAADIRSLPEEKYQGLLAFLQAAVHELGQVISRLWKAVTRSE